MKKLLAIVGVKPHWKVRKMWIANKMREIMKHKSIDKIRVTEIYKAAEIERPTFCYHFKDKYDLAAWMFCTDAYGTDITSVASAAAGMNKMKHHCGYGTDSSGWCLCWLSGGRLLHSGK